MRMFVMKSPQQMRSRKEKDDVVTAKRRLERREVGMKLEFIND
jgi:hypothetical protein